MSEAQQQSPKFAVFRAGGALPYEQAQIMTHGELTPVAAEGAFRLMSAGIEQGHDTRVLFAAPGFSLVYAWFKSGYPLPRHTHNVDCLYYIVGGSLRLGTEELGKGDGFFVGAGVPYTYTPGPVGVEVIEFRASNAFDIQLLANNAAFWDKAVATVNAERESWAAQVPPSTLPA